MQAPRPKKRFYEESWFKIALLPAGLALIYVALQFIPGGTVASWLVDIIAFGMMYFGTLALASQYILPVRTLKERRAAYERLMAYVAGMHGPIVFIRDGALVGTAEELKRKGAGVILVDGSSAVVLEKGRNYSRAAGPGIVFTQFNERLAATFDLRRQARSQDTAALTKDGIEIKTSVSVVFALDPGDQVSPRDSADERDFFGYARITPALPFDPESAFKAYYGFAVTEKQELKKWGDLPIIVATEFFRDHVSRLTLDELFLPKDPDSSPVSALQTRLTDQTQKARLLKDRGVKVYAVSVGGLELPEAVNHQRVRAWAARWQREANTTLAIADVETERIKEKARAEAQGEMLSHFREYVSQAFTGDGDSAKKKIAQKFVDALNRVATDPVTRMLISTDTMKQLSNLRVWVGLPPEAPSEPVKMIGKSNSEDLSEIAAQGVADDEGEEAGDSTPPGGAASDSGTTGGATGEAADSAPTDATTGGVT